MQLRRPIVNIAIALIVATTHPAQAGTACSGVLTYSPPPPAPASASCAPIARKKRPASSTSACRPSAHPHPRPAAARKMNRAPRASVVAAE